MDQALAILNNLADPGPSENVKKQDAEIRGYIASANTVSQASKAALLEDPRRALEVIDPSQNSIGCLYLIDMILSAGTASNKINKRAFLDKIVKFLVRFDPAQIRYVGATFRHLLEVIVSGGLFPPVVTLELLATAILRIDPTGSLFTSTHFLLAKLAVESNIFEPAIVIFDKEITRYPVMSSNREAREARDSRPLCDPHLNPAAYISTATGLTDNFKSGSVLEYNFLRSLAYSSLRDWDKAFAALEQVITHPVKDRGVSKIMSECHKRWILVGLLKSGKVPTLPSYTAVHPTTTYNSLSADYKELASLFVSTRAKDLKEWVEKREGVWHEDGTASLVAEALSAYQKWQIINLRKIFTEISIPEIRRLTCSAQTGELLDTDEDVISLVQGMLASGMLKGALDVDGAVGSFLKFGGPSSMLTEEDFAREIATSHARITALNKQYKDVNTRLSEKREYVKYLVYEQKRAEKEGPDAGVGFDSQIEDEDLMTGIMAHG
ncbi:COP9 subunit 3 [Cordyceps javanica]|uniref:COP9 subunit 3 n=1 Tax=Cordyceps javanica TaxID=43265 RepID=A0A545VSQ2_9HYPO|nr:COP9 subunit 3 [Cordyceps javanica]TQW04716.1 COP9 subunit 3 [Cordyceps javanica]